MLSHDEAKLEGFLLNCGDVFDLLVMVSSQKPFYSTMAVPPNQPPRSRVGEPSTCPRRYLLLGHDEAESEGLLLYRGGVSDFAVTVLSQKPFYLAAAMPLTQP